MAFGQTTKRPLLAALAFFLCSTVTVHSFNLEPRIAIVKHGDVGSYFGFSVSQHQIVSHDRLESLLLVGAPLANSSGATQPGMVLRCPLTAQSADCLPVETMIKSKRSRKKKQMLKESDGQWLGTVVQSQGTGN
jgi:integrin alpha 7